MQMNLRSDIKKKPYSASFTSLQINESFNHFRSVSYFEAVTNPSLSGSRKSFDNYSTFAKSKHGRITSNSTPCTPKKIEIEKYSTLPVTQCNSSLPVKKTRSSSLSSFFRKLRPKFHRSASDAKNPWIVIEFSPHNDELSDDSDNSLELAVKSKVEHFTSLKDLYDNSNNDVCNCALSNKRKDSNLVSPKCNFNSVSASKTSDSFGYRNQKISSKYKSESSIFFRLSPKRRFENLKHMLKRLSNYSRYKNSVSLPSLNTRSLAFKSESCLKNHSFSSNPFSSYNQIENGRPLSPVFHFCKSSKQEYLRNSRYSDVSVLKLPTSRSVNTSLSSVLEDSSLRRIQPPKTLSLCNKSYRDQQVLKLYQKMASVESIGACSLDFETSATDNFLSRKDLTASECTLHSNGLTPSSFKESSRNGSALHDEMVSKEQRLSADGQCLNNCKAGDKKEYSVAEIKLPSYVSISCAINGYTNYSRFCRSRDNSPARCSFRKSSFEPSMLSDINGKDSHSTESNFRYSRSQSDCNGRMHSVYTESKHVTVSKQLQIPIKSTRKYMTEVKIMNGHNELMERTTPSPTKPVSNGHDSEPLALAKEVGNGGTKSLVQQRIESLYGKSAGEDIKVVTVKHLNKREHVNGVDAISPPQSLSTSDKPPRASTSPPVFRHLNKDFRKQLQANNLDDRKGESEKNLKPVKKPSEKQSSSSQLKSNGFTPISNGIGHDECDRVKSKTPPPKLSGVSFDHKISLSKDGPEEEREGYKFLGLVDVEKEKILVQAKSLEEELQNNLGIPEDASGKIRAACGKANLLVSQKFEQFKGLCWKNIEDEPNVPFYTTASDLAGFWDLVMLQIEDINSTFKEIELMRKNNWKEIVSHQIVSEGKPRNTNSKAVSRSNPSTPKRSSKSAELAKAREEARRQLLAAKKKGRQQNTSGDNDVAIFTPASTS